MNGANDPLCVWWGATCPLLLVHSRAWLAKLLTTFHSHVGTRSLLIAISHPALGPFGLRRITFFSLVQIQCGFFEKEAYLSGYISVTCSPDCAQY